MGEQRRMSEANSNAFDGLAVSSAQSHERFMNFLAFVYAKRTVEIDPGEIASQLAGINAADRTPVIKSA